ncbi:MAG: hypothetical protein KIS92_16875 [Planctomycetota bacterium]|nr:hypothetical protein [Planctomycetota bacterium]
MEEGSFPGVHRRSIFSLRGRMVHAFGGALLICVLMPVLLTWMRFNGAPFDQVMPDGSHGAPARPWSLEDLVGLGFFTIILCGPGALVLTYALFSALRAHLRSAPRTAAGCLLRAALQGGALAFLNLPGYLAFAFFQDPFSLIRVGALFAVTGATSGLWIGWQAWREDRPQERAFPRFSLRTLVLLALAWGVLLALFMPMELPPDPPPEAEAD